MDPLNERFRAIQACQIKSRLALHGLRQAHIARALGVSRTAVGYVVNGRRRTAAIQRAIAERLAVHPRELFGPWCHPSLLVAAA